MSDLHATCPYRHQPDQAFWARSVGGVPQEAVSPLAAGPFEISREHRIGTAGSCFAQHVAQRLQRAGFNYFVTEPRHPRVPEQTAIALNYGTFSARFGNVYTARQLRQLFERAYGRFQPSDLYWRQGETYIDPFRPRIQPAGFTSREELEHDRDRHLAAVRQLFEELDVFVFTLGLTEAWQSRRDGAVYPVCPGCGSGTHDPVEHEFINFDVFQVVEDLNVFLDNLAQVNAAARVILTVSPVPLVATMERHSVLLATTYSKSVLRVAADMISRSRANVAYFPAYEIITGSHARGAYFADDLRSVTSLGVDRVMRVFFEAYCGMVTPAMVAVAPPPDPAEDDSSSAVLVKLICDEEQLER